MEWADLLVPGVLIVSGKGGTGKSTVAGALAMAASGSGRRVLLAEVEGRGEMVRTLGIADPGFQERPTRFGFHVLSITPRETVREYLRRYAGMRHVPRSLMRTGTLDQIVTATPGLRDLLALGMVYETFELRPSDPRRDGAPLYDLIVVDAPPTGQLAGFLSAPSTFAGLVRVGRIRRQATNIARMLRRRTRVVLVSLPEEMSVAETLEAIPMVHRSGAGVAAIVANRVLAVAALRSRRPGRSRLTPEEAASLAKGAGLDLDVSAAEAVLEARTAADRRARVQRGFVNRLAEGAPVMVLPELVGVEAGHRVPALARLVSGEVIGNLVSGDLSPDGSMEERNHLRPRSSPAVTTLDEPLASARIVVVCGSGGTGKTTVAAALAVKLAQSGRRTVLLTVDPARRLATALRLPMVPGERVGVPLGGRRSMDAIQLDTKRTFDELIERFANSPEQIERILSNPVYRRITDTLSGTHEYMAMEKLHQLAEGTDYEAIVVDTPPTRSALAFLDAPNRMTDFLGGRFLRWMLWPSAQAGKLTFGAARIGASALLRTVGRLVGTEALADTAEFLGAFQGMYAGFKQRASDVLSLMRSPECAFLVVAAPSHSSLDEAGYFVARLSEGGMRAKAAVVNRWHPLGIALPAGTEAGAERLLAGSADQRTLGEALEERLREELRADAEMVAVSAFAEAHPEVPLVSVPELEADVHDVPGLRTVSAHLFEA